VRRSVFGGFGSAAQPRGLQTSGDRSPGISFGVVMLLNNTRIAQRSTADENIVAIVAEQIALATGSAGASSGGASGDVASNPLQVFAAASALWVRLHGYSLAANGTVIVDGQGQPIAGGALALMGGTTASYGSEVGQQPAPFKPTQFNKTLLAAIIGGVAGLAVLLLAVAVGVRLHRRRAAAEGVTYV
jgi:hypothetical protein